MTTPAPAQRLGSNYRKLFASSVSANLGDGLMTVALVWLASAVTRDAFLIGLIGVASKVPWLVFSLPAGVITDRFDRRAIVGWMDLLRAAIIAALAVIITLFGSDLPTPQTLAAGANGPAAARFSSPHWYSPPCCWAARRCCGTTPPRPSCPPSSTIHNSRRRTGGCGARR